MYRFVGGLINTLQPYNDDEINNKFIITHSFLENIDLLLQDLKDLKNLQENVDKTKLLEYIKKNEQLEKDLSKMNTQLISFIEKSKEILQM